MTKLSTVVSLAGRIAKEMRVGYPIAATIALRRSGFPNPKNTVRETYITDDVGVLEELGMDISLLRAVTSCLGKAGAEARAVKREKGRQMTLALA